MELAPVPKIDSPADVHRYLGALGVHAMEVLHARLAYDELSSNKMLLDFAALALKAGDLMPDKSTALVAAGNGAVINFHFSKPPPSSTRNTIEAVATVVEEPVLPEPPLHLQAAAVELNADLVWEAVEMESAVGDA